MSQNTHAETRERITGEIRMKKTIITMALAALTVPMFARQGQPAPASSSQSQTQTTTTKTKKRHVRHHNKKKSSESATTEKAPTAK